MIDPLRLRQKSLTRNQAKSERPMEMKAAVSASLVDAEAALEFEQADSGSGRHCKGGRHKVL